MMEKIGSSSYAVIGVVQDSQRSAGGRVKVKVKVN